MLVRSALTVSLLGVSFACFDGVPAMARDADLCLVTAERVNAGEELSEEERKAAHEACLRALSDTASITQKYQFQEADFEIMGTRPKN